MKKAVYLSIPLLVIGVGLVLWFISTADWRKASGNLDADIVKARALGIPVEARDILPSPPVPDEDNAASTILAAEDALTLYGPSKKISEELIKSVALPDADPNKLAALLKPADKALAILQKIKGQNRADFHREWDLGPRMLSPDLAEVRKLVSTVLAYAEVASMRHDWRTCLDDLRIARKIVVAQGSEPMIIGLLIGIGQESNIIRTAERALTRMASDPEAIAQIRQFANEAPPLPNFRRALLGEIYFEITTIRNLDLFGGERGLEAQNEPAADGASPEPSEPPTEELIRSGLPNDTKKRAYLARDLEFWTNAMSAPGTDDPVVLSKVLDAEIQKISVSSDPTQRLSKVLVPVFAQAGLAVVRIDAQRRTFAALCEVVSYHQRTGHFPKNLAEIGVRTLDPYNQQPLKMRTDGKSFRVYSVGQDKVDNGGLERNEVPKPMREMNQMDVTSVFPSFTRQRSK